MRNLHREIRHITAECSSEGSCFLLGQGDLGHSRPPVHHSHQQSRNSDCLRAVKWGHSIAWSRVHCHALACRTTSYRRPHRAEKIGRHRGSLYDNTSNHFRTVSEKVPSAAALRVIQSVPRFSRPDFSSFFAWGSASRMFSNSLRST